MSSVKTPQLIWYASYGSNLNRQRFECYIGGGKPIGSTRHHTGCQDKTLPKADMCLELPYSLYFAGHSNVWQGGVAYIAKDSETDQTKSRAYLITTQQFEEIIAQENGRSVANPLDWVLLERTGHTVVEAGQGNYDKVVYIGRHEDIPIVSFTHPAGHTSYNRPAAAYIQTIGTGLLESHTMAPSDVAVYLHKLPGIQGNYSLQELIAIIQPHTDNTESQLQQNINRIRGMHEAIA
jgi:hypothetical protein